MFAQKLAARLARRGVHYGWVVVAVTFITALTTAGAVGVPGALIQPLTKEFGWDTAEISTALAIRLVLFGLMAPFAAALIERYGVRRVVLTAIAMIVAGLFPPPSLAATSPLLLSSCGRPRRGPPRRRTPRPRLHSGAPSRCSARSRRAGPSGSCSPPSSSAGSAPTASSRPISSRSAPILACRR